MKCSQSSFITAEALCRNCVNKPSVSITTQTLLSRRFQTATSWTSAEALYFSCFARTTFRRVSAMPQRVLPSSRFAVARRRQTTRRSDKAPLSTTTFSASRDNATVTPEIEICSYLKTFFFSDHLRSMSASAKSFHFTSAKG